MSEEHETQQEATQVVAASRSVPAVMGSIQTDENLGYIVPRTIEEAYEFARLAVHIAPDSFNGDVKKVTLAIMAAREAGLPPLYGLRNIAIINGRPTIYGDAAMALIQSKNVLAKQIIREIGPQFDIDNTEVSKWPADFGYNVKLWRRGQDEPYEGKFTVGDAKRAGLWLNTRKKPWMEYPKRMLLIRARAFPQRDGFADCLGGIAIREEMEDTFGADKPEVDTASILSDDPEVIEHQPEEPEETEE